MTKRTGNTVASLVTKDLNTKVEQGWSIDRIKHMSEVGIDAYCNAFRLEYAHLLNYSYKDSTVNRYVEQYIKANK